MLSLKININVDTGRPEAELSFGSILPYDEEKNHWRASVTELQKQKKIIKKSAFTSSRNIYSFWIMPEA